MKYVSCITSCVPLQHLHHLQHNPSDQTQMIEFEDYEDMYIFNHKKDSFQLLLQFIVVRHVIKE